MNRGLLFYVTFLLSILATSCHYDGLKINKMVDRINYHEIDLASKYVYPGDHASLFLFDNEALALAPNLELEILDKENYKNTQGEKFVITTLKCNNTTKFFEDFIKKNNLSKDGKTIIDTIAIKHTQKKKYIGFDWGIKHSESENMFPYLTHEEVPVYAGMSTSSQKLISIPTERKIVCKRLGQDTTWYECFFILPSGERQNGYINYHKGQKLDSYFTLGLVESLGIIILLIVTLGFIIIPILLFKIHPVVGIICVVGAIFIVYNMLAHILFELFLIHLPYAI